MPCIQIGDTMGITEIGKFTSRPPLFEPGTDAMWSDPHISQQLLQVHLDPNTDLASRKRNEIERTAGWILAQRSDKTMNMLDLGCGPGLYTQRYANEGHTVTGVDISKSSIEYARRSTGQSAKPIEYINADYLQLELPKNRYDLITMIYADFGVLSPAEREMLLAKVRSALRADGLFIFDALNGGDPACRKEQSDWHYAESGFWSDIPHLAFSQTFHYSEEDVLLHQHLVKTDEGLRLYRFWNEFFTHEKLLSLLQSAGFKSISFHEDVLKEEGAWSGKNVTFCVAGI